MKYLLSILCLFVLSCDDESDIHGCLDSQACNYDETATLDDESCTYAEENFDCDGECTAETDIGCDCGVLADKCLVCGGNNFCTDLLECMDIEACNYSPDATVNSWCIYELNCLGECAGYTFCP